MFHTLTFAFLTLASGPPADASGTHAALYIAPAVIRTVPRIAKNTSAAGYMV